MRVSRSAYVFVALAMTICGGFIGSTMYVESRAQWSDRLAMDAAYDALPSVRLLGEIGRTTAGLQAELERAVDAADRHQAPNHVVIDASRAQLTAAMIAFRPFVTYPGEAEQFQALGGLVAQFDDAMQGVVRAIDAGDIVRARAGLASDIAATTDSMRTQLRALTDLNLEHARVSSLEISRTRQSVTRTAYTLDIVIGLLAVAAVVLAFRAARIEARLREEHERLSETRSSELEMFSNRVAHDLKGPLTTLGLSLQLAQSRRDDPAEAAQAVARARKSLDRMLSMIDGLLDFARSGARPHPDASTELAGTLRGVVDELRTTAHASKVDLVIESLSEQHVACDEGVLISLSSNLLRNAIKYGVDDQSHEIRLRVIEGPGRVRIEVEDHGPGVPDELGTKVFEPYVRGKDHHQSGLGIGLATVKRLAEQHGGAVGLRPASVRGAIFWFELPIVPKVVDDAGPSPATVSAPEAAARRIPSPS